jgi:exonuclease III
VKKGYSGTAIFIRKDIQCEARAIAAPQPQEDADPKKKQTKLTAMWSSKKQPKEETKEETKEEAKEEAKEEPKEETKEEAKEEAKEEPKEEAKEEAKEGESLVGEVPRPAATVREDVKVLKISVDFEDVAKKFEGEGRTITVELDKFFFVGCYVPNSGEGEGLPLSSAALSTWPCSKDSCDWTTA